ncbi:hypothetical protein RHSIM_Rhsim01G0132200 [Rhododendron simsii]|uniref:Uncharacterized protein n=1 Tax=Rhododendron simsii TaxID=118357 RepID=A0A834LVD5_RHOSS|nr:hypothetical protein RHSIM_Rhsim01G0132200 [Rhododendron simsii]
MVVDAPFVRWDKISHDSGGSTRAGVYYLETAQGERVVCAVAAPGEGNCMIYRPLDSFLEDYYNLLPSATVLEWNFRFQLAAWLDGIVYYSFLQYSQEGIGSCWHFASVGPDNVPQDCNGISLPPVQPHGFCLCVDIGFGQLKLLISVWRCYIYAMVLFLILLLLALRTFYLPSLMSHEGTVLKFGHLHLPIVDPRLAAHRRLTISSQIMYTLLLSLITALTQTINPPPTTVDATSLPHHRRPTGDRFPGVVSMSNPVGRRSILTEEDAICLASFRDAQKHCNVFMGQLPRNHGCMKGSGGNPLLGEQAAEESKQAIAASFEGFDGDLYATTRYVYFGAKYILVKVREHMEMDSFRAADALMLFGGRNRCSIMLTVGRVV